MLGSGQKSSSGRFKNPEYAVDYAIVVSIVLHAVIVATPTGIIDVNQHLSFNTRADKHVTVHEWREPVARTNFHDKRTGWATPDAEPIGVSEVDGHQALAVE